MCYLSFLSLVESSVMPARPHATGGEPRQHDCPIRHAGRPAAAFAWLMQRERSWRRPAALNGGLLPLRRLAAAGPKGSIGRKGPCKDAIGHFPLPPLCFFASFCYCCVASSAQAGVGAGDIIFCRLRGASPQQKRARPQRMLSHCCVGKPAPALRGRLPASLWGQPCGCAWRQNQPCCRSVATSQTVSDASTKHGFGRIGRLSYLLMLMSLIYVRSAPAPLSGPPRPSPGPRA